MQEVKVSPVSSENPFHYFLHWRMTMGALTSGKLFYDDDSVCDEAGTQICPVKASSQSGD